jgi:hypothetical protein
MKQIFYRTRVKQELEGFQHRLKKFDDKFTVSAHFLCKCVLELMSHPQRKQLFEIRLDVAAMRSDENPAPKRDRTLLTPSAPSRIFIGRDDILSKLEACFFPTDAASTEEQKCFVLDGLGGSGKTQTALMFIKRHGSK